MKNGQEFNLLRECVLDRYVKLVLIYHKLKRDLFTPSQDSLCTDPFTVLRDTLCSEMLHNSMQTINDHWEDGICTVFNQSLEVPDGILLAHL